MMDRIGRVLVAVGVAAGLAGPVLAQQPPAEKAEKMDLESVLQEKPEVGKAAADAENAPGDNQTFSVTTDDDITSLAVNDIYKSEQTTFKVVTIKSSGAKGGTFVVQRIAGKNPPGRKLNRASGLGPVQVVSRETWWTLYLAGGSLMHPIALCGVFVLIIALNSAWVYRKARQYPDSFIEQARRALQRGDIAEFEDIAKKEKGLFPHICRAMIVRFDASTLDDIKNRCIVEAGRQINRLKAPLKALNMIGAIAPMLGLLGTVTGMVTCFESLAFESASASKALTLAAGIRVALFTTVGGLAVAIPAMIVLYIYNQKLSAIIADCEALTEQFIHDIAQIKR